MRSAVKQRLEVERADPLFIMAGGTVVNGKIADDEIRVAALLGMGASRTVTDLASGMTEFGRGLVAYEASRLAVAGGMAAVTAPQFLGREIRGHDPDTVIGFGLFRIGHEVFVLLVMAVRADRRTDIPVSLRKSLCGRESHTEDRGQDSKRPFHLPAPLLSRARNTARMRHLSAAASPPGAGPSPSGRRTGPGRPPSPWEPDRAHSVYQQYTTLVFSVNSPCFSEQIPLFFAIYVSFSFQFSGVYLPRSLSPAPPPCYTAPMKTYVFALTPDGADLGAELADGLEAELCVPARLYRPGDGGRAAVPFERLAEAVAPRWETGARMVFIAATGIVVRVIAPLIDRKDRDPAVVVLDQAGRFAVSLLSGHLGGANGLAREVADITGGTPVITTATDVAGVPAIDVLSVERNLRLRNLEAVRAVNGALAEFPSTGRAVPVFDPVGLLNIGREKAFRLTDDPAELAQGGPGVAVVWHTPEALGLGEDTDRVVFLHPPVLVLGAGCRRGVSAQDLLDFWRNTLARRGLAVESVAAVASASVKKDEPGLLEAARSLNAPLTFFTPEELAAVPVPNPSATVAQKIGAPSVCEASALKLAATESLLLEKTKGGGMTLAAALTPRF